MAKRGRMLGALVVLGAGAASVALPGCALFQKVLTENLLTQATDDLTRVSARVGYTSNLLPTELGLAEMGAAGEAYVPGASMVGAVLFKRDGIGMYKLEGGSVSIRDARGAETPCTFTTGAYIASLPASDRGPKSVVLRSAKGQMAVIPVRPANPVRIKAVNGKTSNFTWDVGQDLVLDLDLPPDARANGKLRVALVTEQMFTKYMGDLGMFKAANRLVIPKEVTLHSRIARNQLQGGGVIMGANHLLVERVDTQEDIGGPAPLGARQVNLQAYAHAPIQVVGTMPTASLTNTWVEKVDAGGMYGEASKTHAIDNRPWRSGEKWVLAQLTVRATTFKQKSSTSESTSFGVRTITTTTTTFQFPQVPSAYWDRFLAGVYGDMRQSMASAGIELLPPQALANDPTFRNLPTPAATNEQRYVDRTFGGRRVLPEGLEALTRFSGSFPNDQPSVKMLRAIGAKGMMTAYIDLQIGARPDGKLVMVPSMHFAASGLPGHYQFGAGLGTGHVEGKDGNTFSSQQLTQQAGFDAAVNRGQLAAGFKGLVDAMRRLDQRLGYERFWANNPWN